MSIGLESIEILWLGLSKTTRHPLDYLEDLRPETFRESFTRYCLAAGCLDWTETEEGRIAIHVEAARINRERNERIICSLQ